MARVDGRTRHWFGSLKTKGSASRLPTSSERPVNRNGGTCFRATPSVATDAHKAIAPRANRLARSSGRRLDTGRMRLFVGVIAGPHHGADGRMAESHLARPGL